MLMTRYGSWMDTNLVIPTGPDTCRVVYDYYLEKAKIEELLTKGEFENYLNSSLASSAQVKYSI